MSLSGEQIAEAKRAAEELCPKCGRRRGVITHDHWLDVCRRANERDKGWSGSPAGRQDASIPRIEVYYDAVSNGILGEDAVQTYVSSLDATEMAAVIQYAVNTPVGVGSFAGQAALLALDVLMLCFKGCN